MKPEQLEILVRLAASKGYGWKFEHADQVKLLSLKIYEDTSKLGLLDQHEQDKEILMAAALLHDVGRPEEPHNEAAFNMLREKIPRHLSDDPISEDELATVLYCILFHRGQDFSERKGLPLVDPGHSKQLASIIRIADGLDHGPPFEYQVKDVAIDIVNGSLVCQVQPSSKEVRERVVRYAKHTTDNKMDLFRQAFGQDMSFKVLDN